MVLAYNLLGYFTLILGFMGLFSMSVPRWLGLITMAIGGLSMFMSFSRSQLRAIEPLAHALLLVAVAVVALSFHARGWFPSLALSLAALQFAASGLALAWASRHSHGMELPPFLERRSGHPHSP